MEASQKDWLGGRQFDVDRYLHGATLEETVAAGVSCLVTGRRRDSNVYFVQSGGTWVLAGTAWRGRAGLIKSAAETLFGAGARPRAIVLTRVHPDHAGSASELARRWDVTVYVHPGELPLPPSGRIIGALAGVERRWMFPSGQDGLSPIDPDAGVPGLPDWQVIPTPGHLALFREADRALIAGDAVLTVNLNSPGDALSQRHTLGGPPRVATWNWRAATGSVSELARLEPGVLEPSVLAPGHGRPNSALPVPGTKNSFDETHGSGHSFLCSDLLGHDPRSLVHPVIVCRKTNRSCKPIRSQMLPGDRRWADTELGNALAPEELVAVGWRSDRRHTCPQTGGCRPSSPMMDDRGHLRKQPVVRSAIQQQDLVGCVHLANAQRIVLYDPALPALFQCLNDQPGHSNRIGGRHAAEADIHRRWSGIQKSLERRGWFPMGWGIQKPVTGHVNVVAPICRSRHDRRAVGTEKGIVIAQHLTGHAPSGQRAKADSALVSIHAAAVELPHSLIENVVCQQIAGPSQRVPSRTKGGVGEDSRAQIGDEEGSD